MDTLDRALALWRAKPTRCHAELVQRASWLILREPVLNVDEWLAIEATGDPADVARLIAALMLVDRQQVCVDRLLDRPADPRIVAAAIELLELPYARRAHLAPSLWQKLLRFARAHGDVTHSQRLFDVAKRHDDFGDANAYELARTATEVANHLRKRAVPVDHDLPLTCELAAELDQLEQRRRSIEQHAWHLFDAVWAEPDDDAPRAVLADFFNEIADPRGEFVALQLAHHAGKLGAQGRKREQKLLTRYKRAWIGAIKPLVSVPYARFERGFIVGCQLARREELVEKLGDHPAWSTLREFTLHPITREQHGHVELASKLRLRCARFVDSLSLGIA